MKAKRAQIVQMVEGQLISSEIEVENLIPAMEVRGAKVTGVKSQRGSIPVREEILGQPTFDNFAGPMYNGPGVVRYESWSANERLSA